MVGDSAVAADQSAWCETGLFDLFDLISRVYTPLMLTIALAAFLSWAFVPQLFGFAPDLQRTIFANLSVLVMGYPFAVGITALLSIVRGAGEAAEKGILMQTGEAFQGYRLVSQIDFDMTGTLTEGKRQVRTEIHSRYIRSTKLPQFGCLYAPVNQKSTMFSRIVGHVAGKVVAD